jgi:hypothetical protein
MTTPSGDARLLALARTGTPEQKAVACEIERLEWATAARIGNPLVDRFCRVAEGHYVLNHAIAHLAGTDSLLFEVERLRRESHALVCELVVRTSIFGAQTYDGILSAGDLNLSSVRARAERAKYLAARSRVPDDPDTGLDWSGLLEELAQRIIAAERAGQPPVLLRDLPRPSPDDVVSIDGIEILARHPMIFFGDGGAAKSYLALYLAGRLAQLGHGVVLFDWELAGEDHRDRLERLFGPDMPPVEYVRCTGPLVHEGDRLRKVIRTGDIRFAIFDSVAFACDGPPEAAEVASRYFQTLRALGQIGSIHVAHVSKAEGSDFKPFGSAFWHNGARSTWFVSFSEPMPGASSQTLGLINRKANMSRLREPVAFEVTFGETATTFKRVAAASAPDLVSRLSMRQRLALTLRGGAMAINDLAQTLDTSPATLRNYTYRYRDNFVLLDGGKSIGLRGHP